jgi:hypothetical protein
MPTVVTEFGLIAVLALAIGYLLGTGAAQFGQTQATGASQSISFNKARDGFTLVLTLALATYLMLVSILATQIFDPKLADFSGPRTRLEQSLSRIIAKEAPESLKQLPTTVTIDFGDMASFLDSIRQNSGLDEYVKRLADQLKLYAAILKDQPKLFVPKAKEEAEFIRQQFEIQNHDHFGLRQAQGHVDALILYFENWISNWTLTAKKCRDSVGTEQSLFIDFTDKIKKAIKQPEGKGDFPQWPSPVLGVTLAPNCDFDSALSNTSLPVRDVIDKSLGQIGGVAGWLLKTESRDIALMTGLLGFGLFGAVSASFIRPSTNGSRMTSTVFVRGMSAAILVYLAVIGGLAVFSREAIPNPYAVYFACLVAAVFSEDVWKWAEQRQQASFGARKSKARFDRRGEASMDASRPSSRPPDGALSR